MENKNAGGWPIGLLTTLLASAPETFAPFATFAVYAIIAAVRKDQALLSAQAFASLSLISLVTTPLNVFCQALPSFFQVISCFSRIELYCLKTPSHVLASLSTPSPMESSIDSTQLKNLQSSSMSNRSLVSFEKVDISWSPNASQLVLHNLTLDIRQGFTAVIGPIASGKSTLLESIIGETTLQSGSMSTPLSGVAYCSQTPWISNNTIRQNITGDLGFDKKWYEYSLSCCNLQEDLDKIPEGDQSDAGSNGMSLSGGQRQRVVGVPISLGVLQSFFPKLTLTIHDIPGSCPRSLLQAPYCNTRRRDEWSRS